MTYTIIKTTETLDQETQATIKSTVFAIDFTLDDFNKRLDACLASYLTDYSRTKIQESILEGLVKVDGVVITAPAHKLEGFESCEIEIHENIEVNDAPENIELNIVYEDNDILVINKPRDMVVHPGAGVSNGTLLNALLFHYPELAKVPRAGIVHRLDKDTTGLMVVAKNITAQLALVEQLASKTVTREYEAIAYGIMTRGGKVDAPIGRHPTKRLNMAVTEKGKPAVTHYRIMEAYRNYTRLRLRLETGRTHQIRVHMSHIKHALLGDVTYGGNIRLPKNATPELVDAMREFKRQALHAIKLELVHPSTQELMKFEAPLPQDMASLVKELQRDRDLNQKED